VATTRSRECVKYTQLDPDMFNDIFNNGPVVVTMSVESAFYNYKTGVFSCTGPISYNHQVVAVGFGVEADSTKYILVRNSWG
jgi:C1A family cysteine protease